MMTKLKQYFITLLIISLTIQTSFVIALSNPQKAQAINGSLTDIPSTTSGGNVANTDYVLGPPHDSNYALLANNSDFAYGSGFSGTGIITQVKIAAKGHWKGTNSNDVVTLSHNKGETSTTTSFQKDSDMVVEFDITNDISGGLSWANLNDLQVKATYTVSGGKDNTTFHINTLWIEVLTETCDPFCVALNEFVSDPGDGYDWVELYNICESSVDLTGWYLKDAADNKLDLSGTLPGHNWLAFDWNAKLNKDADTITLYDPFDMQVDTVTYNGALAAPDQDKSDGRLPDGTGTWQANLSPTKGSSNSLPQGDSIAPSTATISSPENGKTYNASTMPATFTGIAADDPSGEGLNANSTTFYLKNATNQYWDGFSWGDAETWLATTHDASIAGTAVDWTSDNLTNPLPTWTDGPFTAKAKVIDKNSNTKLSSEITFTYDSAPTGTIKINDGKGVTDSREVNLTLSASEDTTHMMLGNNKDFSIGSVPVWEPFSTSKAWALTENNGLKTVYVKYKDGMGNISDIYSATIYYSDKASNIVQKGVAVGDNVITDGNIVVTLNAKTETTLTIARYSDNPEMSDGFAAFGGYFDISVENANAINFPAEVKIYYTQADLDAAGITDESQIKGLYYWDSDTSSWKLYDDTGVNTTDVINGYVGYVWANVDHFTPMTMGADITPPNKPANFAAAAADGEVELKWDKVDDAVGYYVRYRKSKDDVSYTTVYLSGKDSTSTKVTGLTNGTEYEFGVAAKDAAGNISQYAEVVQTPQATAEEAKVTTAAAAAAKEAFISKAYAAPSEKEIAKEEIKDTEIETIGPEEGEIKAAEEEAEGPNWTRVAVTLSILVIAAGAGLGGYYGYQWWIGQNEADKKKKKSGKSGRW